MTNGNRTPLQSRQDEASIRPLTTEDIFRQMSKVHELPTLSAVAVQVNQMLQDINTSAQDLARVIEKDHAIVPKLLKLVNSAFFGFKKKVSNVAHAVMLVGYNTVRNAVISIAIIDSFGASGRQAGFDITASWRHAISVGVVSQYLDKMVGSRFRETIFTAGLIHDIGKLIMLRYYGERFCSVLKTMQEAEIPFFKAELQHFPISHPVIGARLAMQWKLPEELSNVIAYHHKPDRQQGDHGLALLIHTADAFVNNTLEPQTSKNIDWPICMEAWKTLPAEIRSLKENLPELKKEIASACELLLEGKR